MELNLPNKGGRNLPPILAKVVGTHLACRQKLQWRGGSDIYVARSSTICATFKSKYTNS